ncbi:PREDICTED: RNA exonuclease 1 homolog, partial [Buceros rhinoceros silvestris]|uniref:RNA exonuclease 1 homolog n=1 Tax=Buceros rhinoceros silvestris TaxID=175836 RepID=UPI00052853A4
FSPVTNEDENVKQQYKPTEEFPWEDQNGNSDMSPFRSRHLFTERSRSPPLIKLEIKLQDSDDERELVIDLPPQPVNKKRRTSKNSTNGNRVEELSAAICAEELHDSPIAGILGCTEAKPEEITVLPKNSKSLKQGSVSPKANKMYLPDVNTGILNVLEERDALVYHEEKHVSSAMSEADMKKEILRKGNAATSILVEALVQEHANEDCVSSRGVTQCDLCAGHLSKDETIIGRPYKQITNTEGRQSIEENGGNDRSADGSPYPTYYLNKKESEITLLSSSAEEAEPSGEDTEVSESDDPLEECQRIFDEYEREIQKKSHVKQAHGGKVDLHSLESTVNIPGQKRRIAHVSKSHVHNKNEMEPLKTSPWQQGRDAENQQTQMEFSAAVERGQTYIPTASKQKTTMSVQFQSTGPMASLQFLEVQPIEIMSGRLPILLEGSVAAVPCGLPVSSFRRATLVPYKVSTQQMPSIQESRSKVPLQTRERYISLFFSECFQICGTVKEAFDKALIEEQSIYDRCGSKKMYLNFAAKTLKKLRDHGQLTSSGFYHGTVMSEEEKAFSGDALYELLKVYLLTEEQLKQNNFPHPNPEKNGGAILPGVVKNAEYDAFKRVCCRCGTVYTVTSSGEHRSKEECNYHSGQILKQKVPGGMEKRYSCCERIVGSAGCQTAKLHVHDGRKEKLEGFMKAFVKSPPSAGTYGVYALDCEMCYTTHGLEVTRVTVVDAKLQVIYDSLVKPDGKVIDYDLSLSGVTEDDVKYATTSLRNVQAILLNLFSADTILIGHNLEKNLLALKLIHYTVIDTSVVFPHRLGFPHKRALRSLTAEYLRRIHQDDVAGHNSREDAIACMELILWKVREDNKWRKR